MWPNPQETICFPIFCEVVKATLIFLMFSRVFCRDTNPITVENENAGDSPVIPQV